MNLELYQIDAFTDKVFSGNPAAVCPLREWPDDKILQNIAMENNLSETSFFIKEKDGYYIRWFTPTTEVKLCGHATIASAFVIFNYLTPGTDNICFNSKSGKLYVRKQKNTLILNFPQELAIVNELSNDYVDILGEKASSIHCISDHSIMAVFNSEESMRLLKPDLHKLLKLEKSLVVTSKSKLKSVDFVSRCFCPQEGINEDPVTGSNHCFLGPFWSGELNKKSMVARQLSRRGGELFITLLDDNRIEISGKAILYMKSEIFF